MVWWFEVLEVGGKEGGVCLLDEGHIHSVCGWMDCFSNDYCICIHG